MILKSSNVGAKMSTNKNFIRGGRKNEENDADISDARPI